MMHVFIFHLSAKDLIVLKAEGCACVWWTWFLENLHRFLWLEHSNVHNVTPVKAIVKADK